MINFKLTTVEKEINIDNVNLIDIYGVNNKNFKLIENFFPKLKIIARGDSIKLIGNKNDIKVFEDKFGRIMGYLEKGSKLSENNIMQILESDNAIVPENMPDNNDDVLVHGENGVVVRAKTINQKRMVDSCNVNDLVFAIGPAGTGKTYTAVALAVRALKNKEVKRIILTRPAVEAGENLGFLPGDLKEKLDPYLQPLYDALGDMLPQQKLKTYIEDKIIEIAPLAFMRGRTLSNVFAILDEAQNATIGQLKMFLTRMGKMSKFFVTGDITQIDLPKNQASGLVHATGILKDVKGIDFVYLDNRDIIRHKLVTDIVNAYENNK